jgi:hypothetical protein|tara:strand:+ start:139 stop:516 length:378 start_codon:yes stop_codon:yes gene_type:complete
MKVKISLIVTSHDDRFNLLDPRRVKVLLSEDNAPPAKYISTKNEDETLREICENCLNYHYDWLLKDLTAFRVLNSSEAEVVYLTTVPAMDSCNKTGRFYSAKQLEEVEIDKFYVQLISKFGAARR